MSPQTLTIGRDVDVEDRELKFYVIVMFGEEEKYETVHDPRLIVTSVVLPVKRVPLVVTPTNHENERVFVLGCCFANFLL